MCVCVYTFWIVYMQTHAGKVVAALLVSGMKSSSLKILRQELMAGGITSAADASSLDAWAQKMGVTMNRSTPTTPK